MGTPAWFISHTHLDHVAALPLYVARRRMMKMEPPMIYLPDGAVDPVDRLLRAFSRLDRGRLPCDLIGLSSGDEVESLARAGRHRLGHRAHGPFAGLHRLGTAPQAEGGIQRAHGRADSRPAPRRRVR